MNFEILMSNLLANSKNTASNLENVRETKDNKVLTSMAKIVLGQNIKIQSRTSFDLNGLKNLKLALN